MLTWYSIPIAQIAIGILYSGIAHERQPNFRHRKKDRNGGILRRFGGKRGYADMRVCGYAGMRVCGYAGMRICGYVGMRICGYADMRVRRTGLRNRFQKLINNSKKNYSCEGVFICGKTHVDFHKTLTSIFSTYTTSIY